MIIFNNTDHPVRLTLGGKDYLLDRSITELEDDALPRGAQALRVEIVYKTGELSKREIREEPFSRGYASYALAVSATLTVGENTYLHIDEEVRRSGRRFDLLRYRVYAPSLSVERGTLSDVRRGFASASRRHWLLWGGLTTIAMGALVFLAFLSATATVWLGGNRNRASGAELAADILLFLGLVAIDGLVLFCVAGAIKAFKTVWRQKPV